MLKAKIDYNESCIRLLSAEGLAKLRWCLDNVIPLALICEQVIK